MVKLAARGTCVAWNCIKQSAEQNQSTEQTAQLFRDFFSHVPNLFLYCILLFFQNLNFRFRTKKNATP